MTDVLIKREKLGQKQTQKMPGDVGGRDYKDAAADQGLPGATRSWKRKERKNLPRGLAENSVLPTPWFQIPSFPNCEKLIFCCLKTPVCGTLL